MNCQFCSREASVHLTKIIRGRTQEIHLCDACSRENELFLPDSPSEIDVPALVQFLVGQTSTMPTEAESDPGDICPHCGMKYAAFRVEGRLGCPHEYEAFQGRLEPLLEKIHRRLRHVGKIPARRKQMLLRREIETWRGELAGAIASENFEEAARLRDRIRQRRPSDES